MFSESDNNYRMNDLDLPAKKAGAVVKPCSLDLSLQPALSILQAENCVSKKSNIAAGFRTWLSDQNPGLAD